MNKFEKISLASIIGLSVLSTTAFATTGRVYNTSQGLVLRGSASKTGEPLSTVANGAEVEILEENDEWYKVNANGKEGYLFAEYVEVPKEENETPVDNEVIPENTASAGTKIYILPVITSTVIGEVPENTEVNIEKTVGNWDYIVSENVKGWVRANSKTQTEELISQEEENKPEEETKPEEPTETEKPEETKPEKTENTNVSFRKGYINSSSVNVRKEPSTSSDIVTTLVLNTGVTISAQTEEWYKIVYGDYMGYIYKPLISETPVATSRSAEARQPEEETTQTLASKPVAPTPSAGGNKIVSFAEKYKGHKYVYGGTTPSGFDCSGFVYYVFNNCGYSLSRSCSVQAQSGDPVSRENLMPGDILFFNNTSNGSIGHVGIYIGDGQFIHAANPRRGVVTDTINSGYYNTYYYSARRVAK